jgi:aspartate racemase
VTDPVGPALGILGGMGPAASAEFLRLFTASWPASRDQDHPRVILLSEPAIPDRTTALGASGPDPTEMIGSGLRRLASWGASLLAVPCNTAFAFIDRAELCLPAPVVHTVAVTLEEARRAAPSGAWLLATEGTVAARLYQSRAEALGYRLLIPHATDQSHLMDAVHDVKAGKLETAAELVAWLADRLWTLHPATFLLGCTELPLVWRAAAPHPAVDCLAASAAECVRLLSRFRPLPADPFSQGVTSAL